MEGFAGKVAVVTGAGSGIGQALAIELARSGARVAISDVNTEGLAATEERLKAIGAQVKADRLDVTEREAFELYADAVKEHFGKVNQIYNNAGIAFAGDIEVSPFKDIEKVMDVDFWGVVNGTKVFLPHLVESGDGHVINISSVFGLFSVPGQAAYNAAKFAVRGFTEALRQEMMAAGHPVKVTTVHPGGIRTNIAFFRQILEDPQFRAGQLHTGFIDEFFARTPPPVAPPELAVIAALVAALHAHPQETVNGSTASNRWLSAGREGLLR